MPLPVCLPVAGFTWFMEHDRAQDDDDDVDEDDNIY